MQTKSPSSLRHISCRIEGEERGSHAPEMHSHPVVLALTAFQESPALRRGFYILWKRYVLQHILLHLFMAGGWFLNLHHMSRAIQACLKVNKRESTCRQEPNLRDLMVLSMKSHLLRREDKQDKPWGNGGPETATEAYLLLLSRGLGSIRNQITQLCPYSVKEHLKGR